MQAEQTEKSQAVDCCWDAQRQEMIGQTTIYFLGHLFKDKNRAFASRCHLTTATRMPWGKLLCSVFFSFVKNRSCVTQICITKLAAKCILVVVVKLCHRANVLLRCCLLNLCVCLFVEVTGAVNTSPVGLFTDFDSFLEGATIGVLFPSGTTDKQDKETTKN